MIPAGQSDIPYCRPSCSEYKLEEETGHGLLLVEWLGAGQWVVSNCIGHHLFCMLKFLYSFYYNLLLQFILLSTLSVPLNCLYFSPWCLSLSLFWFPHPSCSRWGIVVSEWLCSALLLPGVKLWQHLVHWILRKLEKKIILKNRFFLKLVPSFSLNLFVVSFPSCQMGKPWLLFRDNVVMTTINSSSFRAQFVSWPMYYNRSREESKASVHTK